MLRKILFSLLMAGFILITYILYIRYSTDRYPITSVLPPQESKIIAPPKPLKTPADVSISVFTSNLTNPRVMIWDQKQRLLVSSTSSGQISVIEDSDQDGVSDPARVLISGLNKPHGLAIDHRATGDTLYVAEEHQVTSFTYDVDSATATDKQSITSLPRGRGHFTRTLGIGPDNRLYVSVGSSCNVCHESDNRRATVLVMDLDGGSVETFATGLRNSVFFTWHPLTGQLWATDMGRDWLGDTTPPDEINIVESGKHYGWPYCYGQKIHDNNFDKSGSRRQFCEQDTVGSVIDIPAHSAPLGLAFVPDSWPGDWQGDLIVAYHGSWNRSTPTGYKVVRVDLDNQQQSQGIADFITGWLDQNQNDWGRPADVKFGPDEALYISDDKAGLIYRAIPK